MTSSASACAAPSTAPASWTATCTCAVAASGRERRTRRSTPTAGGAGARSAECSSGRKRCLGPSASTTPGTRPRPSSSPPESTGTRWRGSSGTATRRSRSYSARPSVNQRGDLRTPRSRLPARANRSAQHDGHRRRDPRSPSLRSSPRGPRQPVLLRRCCATTRSERREDRCSRKAPEHRGMDWRAWQESNLRPAASKAG